MGIWVNISMNINKKDYYQTYTKMKKLVVMFDNGE